MLYSKVLKIDLQKLIGELEGEYITAFGEDDLSRNRTKQLGSPNLSPAPRTRALRTRLAALIESGGRVHLLPA